MERTFKIKGEEYAQWFMYGIEFLTPKLNYEHFGKLHYWNRFIQIVEDGKEPITVIFQNTENWPEDTIIIYPNN